MVDRLRERWPEYAMEAAELGAFLIAACLAVVLLEHPSSPARALLTEAWVRRVLTGLAMGATATAIVYSPWGRRSGAHFNPAVTLAFLRLGKVDRRDAAFYVIAHFVGATLGMLAVVLLVHDLVAHPSVAFVATRPEAGVGIAFVAEATISFAMMALILGVSNHEKLAPHTGWFAGAAVATFISVEAPLSGMSMNPARSFGPALVAGRWDGIWIYFAAPLLGMLLAAESWRWRRRPAAALRIVLAVAALALLSPRALASEDPIERVGAIAMTVSDADRAAAFYESVLSFEKIDDVAVAGGAWDRLEGLSAVRLRVVRLRLGEETLELFEYAPKGEPIPGDSRSNDRWFQHVAIIVSDMDRAYAHLQQHDVRRASPAPQTLPLSNPNAGGIRAFYFFDPDGHPLEILEFPPGKGDPRWQQDEPLFLGIDHTAIVVGDTAASLRFYRDALGFTVAGESENFGPEQERLNAVPGARLRITGLRAPAGPGIELLEYLAPDDGRPISADVRASDLAHWQTTLEAAAPDEVLERLRRQRASLVSPGLVDLPDGTLGFDLGFLARDPDGHAVAIVRKGE
jgi:MIP family channel proteins